MALNFPNSPTVGDLYEGYQWDGSAWRHVNVFADTIPAGTIVPWSTETAPANWLICDGAAVSRSTYAALFSVIGIRYGAGNGSTTFNLPNLVGRVPVGRDVSQSEFDVLGETGGAKTHTLTVDQMPSHSHTDTGHSHGQFITANAGGPAIRWDYRQDGSAFTYPQGNNTGNSSANITATGGGQAHNNLQPYVVLTYIIKTTFGTTPSQSQSLDILSTYNSRLTQAELDIDGLESFRGANLPVFQARLAANHVRSGGASWAKINNLSTVEVNQGSHYNGSLSRFVAPVAGIYDFSASFHTTAAVGGPAIAFVKNDLTGTVDGMIYNASYNTTTINRKMQLAVGDRVEVWSWNVNSTSFTFDTGWGGLFSGQLLN